MEISEKHFCVILAGGKGRRLWPCSREQKPKQFIDFFGTGRTQLQATFDRFVRGVLRDGRVSLPQGHSSGQLASSVGTNCLAEIPPADAPLEAGSMIRVWLL